MRKVFAILALAILSLHLVLARKFTMCLSNLLNKFYFLRREVRDCQELSWRVQKA